MKRLKVGLNGFGRVNRIFTRIALQRNSFDIVAVNTRKTSPSTMAHLLKYDSVYRTLPDDVKGDDAAGQLLINGQGIIATQIPEPEHIPWDEWGVDVVIDGTGVFLKKPDLEKHLKPGVKRIMATAPSKDEETPIILIGVNDEDMTKDGPVVFSNASCTTNCAAPMAKVLDNNFTIISGFISTAHAYTSSQSLVDESNKKVDRCRAAAVNMIPSTTGAAKSVARALPQLKGKMDAMAIRMPLPCGSLVDFSAVVERPVTVEAVNAAFRAASEGAMKGILEYSEEPLVSSDCIGTPFSCIFDARFTKVIGNLVKTFGWYDNEWGYCNRLADWVERIAEME